MFDHDDEMEARFDELAQLASDDASELEAFSIVVERLRASDAPISFDRDAIWESIRAELSRVSDQRPEDSGD